MLQHNMLDDNMMLFFPGHKARVVLWQQIRTHGSQRMWQVVPAGRTWQQRGPHSGAH